MKILIADDNEKNRDFLRTVLGHLGHEVVEAGSGSEAVARARQTPPALMILDLQMPEMDGFAVARELRADALFRQTPIIALTAYAMKGDRERALAAGFSSYLAKPIGLAQLRAEIARWSNPDE